jgi:hypothetical protein
VPFEFATICADLREVFGNATTLFSSGGGRGVTKNSCGCKSVHLWCSAEMRPLTPGSPYYVDIEGMILPAVGATPGSDGWLGKLLKSHTVRVIGYGTRPIGEDAENPNVARQHIEQFVSITGFIDDRCNGLVIGTAAISQRS